MKMIGGAVQNNEYEHGGSRVWARRELQELAWATQISKEEEMIKQDLAQGLERLSK